MKYLLAITFTLTAFSIGIAQPSALDNSFGSGGIVTTSFGNGNDAAYAVALQSDGKIVVVGSSAISGNINVSLVRLNPDGTLDNGFGTGGKVTAPVGSDVDYGNAVAIQPDGKIVVAGYFYNGSNNDGFLLRYNADGTPDNGFGTGGKVIIAYGNGDDNVFGMALQSDGKIVVAGSARNDFALARFLSDGTPDNSFGTSGKVTTPITSHKSAAFAIALQSDGKIVVNGYTFNDTDEDIAIARYNSNGSLDATFGSTGIVTVAFGTDDEESSAVAIQPDGKILITGFTVIGDYSSLLLARYKSNGTLDSSFGTAGSVFTGTGTADYGGFGVAVQPDGKIVVAGTAANDVSADVVVARYNSDGSPETAFGTGGLVSTPIGNADDFGYALALQPDQKIVVAGFSSNGTNDDFAVLRYVGGVSSVSYTVHNTSAIVSPNPIRNRISLQYDLQHNTPVTIRLVDMLGNTAAMLMNRTLRYEGTQSENFIVPEELPSGAYFVSIETADGRTVVPVVK